MPYRLTRQYESHPKDTLVTLLSTTGKIVEVKIDSKRYMLPASYIKAALKEYVPSPAFVAAVEAQKARKLGNMTHTPAYELTTIRLYCRCGRTSTTVQLGRTWSEENKALNAVREACTICNTPHTAHAPSHTLKVAE